MKALSETRISKGFGQSSWRAMSGKEERTVWSPVAVTAAA